MLSVFSLKENNTEYLYKIEINCMKFGLITYVADQKIHGGNVKAE